MSTAGDPFQRRWTQAIGFPGPQLRIPYRFIDIPEFGFAEADQDKIRAAVNQISDELAGCIEFYDDTETKIYHDKYIVFRHKNANGNFEGCHSSMGMVTQSWGIPNDEGGFYQQIGLGPGCLYGNQTIQHEAYHALGFAHEQNRNDRDENIVVHWDNIASDAHIWFQAEFKIISR